MKAKELKTLLKNVPDDNPIGFYIVGVEWTDEEDVNLGTPEVICSNGLTQEGCLDFGFEITDRKKMAINRMAEEEDVKRLNKEA
tara:strand:- start:216 stop:467 length:252 start_codon:yes stop_codon:yes gene_type:complete